MFGTTQRRSVTTTGRFRSGRLRNLVLPLQLQIGDRFTDEEGAWEIAERPWTTNAGKLVHAAVQKPGDPASKRDNAWGAHERLAIRRG